MDAWSNSSARSREPVHALLEIIQFSNTLRSLPDERPEHVRNKIEGDDQGCHYYRFLHELVKSIQATAVAETGTRFGCSAIQMAWGNPKAKVVTVDTDPNCSARIEEFGASNIVPVLGDSISAFSHVETLVPAVDLVYLDSDHSFGRILAEYVVYSCLVRDGGFILFDDIEINSDLKRFWRLVKYPKTELNHLHQGFGFGIAIKVAGMSPL